MRIYLDDDSLNDYLVQLLLQDGHDVLTSLQAGNGGKKDPDHFMHTILDDRVLLTHNHDDFELLHKLIVLAGGHHPGVLTVRRDNDAKRDLKPKGIVRAIRKMETACAPVADHLNVLNHWR